MKAQILNVTGRFWKAPTLNVSGRFLKSTDIQYRCFSESPCYKGTWYVSCNGRKRKHVTLCNCLSCLSAAKMWLFCELTIQCDALNLIGRSCIENRSLIPIQPRFVDIFTGEDGFVQTDLYYCVSFSSLELYLLKYVVCLRVKNCCPFIYSKIPILRPPLGLSKSGLKDHFWTVQKVVSNQRYTGWRKWRNE